MKYIDTLRKKIDGIDHTIIKLLSERFKISRLIQQYKKQKRVAIMQKNREITHLKRLVQTAKLKKIPHMLVKAIYRMIFRYSRKLR